MAGIRDYSNTVAVNERAAEVDREYFANTGVIGTYYGYYVHNLQFILYARGMQGSAAGTQKAVEQISAASEALARTMPGMVEFLRSYVTMARLRVYQWNEVLSAKRPDASNPLRLALWHHARALAFIGKAQFKEAARSRRISRSFETALIGISRGPQINWAKC